MALKFKAIPPYLQKNIAARLNSYEFSQFEISSKYGRNICKWLDHTGILEIPELEFYKVNVEYIATPYKNYPIRRRWSYIRELSKLPMFSVRSIQLYNNASLETLNEISNRATFFKNKVILEWSKQGENAVEMFKKLSQMFTIEEFAVNMDEDGFDGDEELVSLPQFSEIKSISYPAKFMPSERFLEIQAERIVLYELDSHPSIGTTLNQYFKQWFSRERRIIYFAVSVNHEHPSMQPDALFENLKFSLFWSDETERNPIASSLADIYSDWYSETKIYSIDRGDQKLFVYIFPKGIIAEEDIGEDPLRYYIMNRQSEFGWRS